jgi:hypothetical protein
VFSPTKVTADDIRNKLVTGMEPVVHMDLVTGALSGNLKLQEQTLHLTCCCLDDVSGLLKVCLDFSESIFHSQLELG